MEYPQRDFNHISDISENYNSFSESVTSQILEKDKLNDDLRSKPININYWNYNEKSYLLVLPYAAAKREKLITLSKESLKISLPESSYKIKILSKWTKW